MAELFESSEKENNNEFVGFTVEEIPERPVFESDPEASGESDISLEDEWSESGSENSDSEKEEVEEDGIWTRHLNEIDIASFKENVAPTEILPEGANCLDILLILFPEELINLIVVETNRNAKQKPARANKVDKDWQPANNNNIRLYLGIRLLQGIKVLVYKFVPWSEASPGHYI